MSAIEDINNFERYLTRQGIVIRKFYLHVSTEEQKRRFLKRLDEPEKHWKFSVADVHEREHFDDYMRAYDDAIRDGDALGAVVRRAGRPQVVHASGRGLGRDRDARVGLHPEFLLMRRSDASFDPPGLRASREGRQRKKR